MAVSVCSRLCTLSVARPCVSFVSPRKTMGIIHEQSIKTTMRFESHPHQYWFSPKAILSRHTIHILPHGKGTLKDLRNHLIETMEGYRELDGSSIRKIRQVVQYETCDKITLLPTWQDLRTNICRVVMGRHMRSMAFSHRSRLTHRVIAY